MKTIKAGIVGGAGYTGGELIRLLLNHPNVEIAFVHSKSKAGNKLHKVHTDLLGETDLTFTSELSSADVLFLCVGRGEAKEFLKNNPISNSTKLIDLSQDHRIRSPEHTYVYGLPELNRDKIASSTQIANPGCFATAIQLSLLPLAKKKLLKNDIHISATTGSTGAGQSLSANSHFSWRNNNLSTYKAFEHQHLDEISESFVQLQGSLEVDINFIPYRGPFTRGILSSAYIQCDLEEDEILKFYEEYYKEHPFVWISSASIDLKQVVNTNKCLLHLQKQKDKLLITSVIDNLLKGASGQAVQNMNLMFGIEETAGLKLKAIGF
jgi:N-acetyl-gamma-glutamyl-phosphate reductase